MIGLGKHLFALVIFSFALSAAPQGKTKNVFLITTDGLRWQEVFSGAEEQLMTKTNGGVLNTNALRRDFLRDTPEARRKALLPFFWSEISSKGQIFGNQQKGSVARVTNGRFFSYPGYSEFLTGVVDPNIKSNDKRPNPNTNVFEWLNLKPAYKGKVAAVVNWDVIPWILNAERSKLPVWSGFPLPKGAPERIKISPALDQLIQNTTPLWDMMMLDTFTHQAAMDYVKSAKPRALYIAYGETDEWAHESRYDLYLRSAYNVDRYIKSLWEMVQAMPEYRDQTTFIITTDHGRGVGKSAWKNHGAEIAEAEFIWLAVIGPDTAPLGERSQCGVVTQSQVAATIAALLGEDFCAAVPQAARPIADVLKKSK
ncbi:MAG: AP protein [Pedosphaera sp.]|nr:AP protein [Pedosphaera sp.]MSU44210.1 AP protein [Pedosphaera sp.]